VAVAAIPEMTTAAAAPRRTAAPARGRRPALAGAILLLVGVALRLPAVRDRLNLL
jgi:hypothetical protein